MPMETWALRTPEKVSRASSSNRVLMAVLIARRLPKQRTLVFSMLRHLDQENVTCWKIHGKRLPRYVVSRFCTYQDAMTCESQSRLSLRCGEERWRCRRRSPRLEGLLHDACREHQDQRFVAGANVRLADHNLLPFYTFRSVSNPKSMNWY